MDFHNNSQNTQDLSYDLRQIYAKIVGEHLFDVAQTRKNNRYADYYKSLHDLYIVTYHKFKDKQTSQTKYAELRNKAATIARQYEQAWIGRSNDAQACAEIQESLNTIEMFLYLKMEEANIFGSNKKIPGL